jgi:hypothetical protein
LPAAKLPGVRRIVVVGDSFAQGYGVDRGQSFPSRLEFLLEQRDPDHGYEVVNLGVPGTNPFDYLGNLRAVGLLYEPDVVIVALMANDVQDVRSHIEQHVRFSADVLPEVQQEVAAPRSWWKRAPNALLPHLYPLLWRTIHPAAGGASVDPATGTGLRSAGAESERTALPQIPVDRWQDVLLGFADRFGEGEHARAILPRLSADEVSQLQPLLTARLKTESNESFDAFMLLLGVTRPRLFADAVLLPPSYDAAWQRTTDLLDEIDATARRAGARTLVTFIPALHQVSPAGRGYLEAHRFEWDDRTLVDTTFSDRLATFGQESGIAVLDLLPLLRAEAHRPGSALYYPEDGHWTPRAHALAARALADALLGSVDEPGLHPLQASAHPE